MRPCSVCTHPERDRIDGALASRTLSDISDEFGPSRSALHRHKAADHIAQELSARARRRETMTAAENTQEPRSETATLLDGLDADETVRACLVIGAAFRRWPSLLQKALDLLDSEGLTALCAPIAATAKITTTDMPDDWPCSDRTYVKDIPAAESWVRPIIEEALADDR